MRRKISQSEKKKEENLYSLLNEKNSDQHSEKLPCHPCKSGDDCASIEYSKQKKKQGSPHADPIKKTKFRSDRVNIFLLKMPLKSRNNHKQRDS